MHEPCNVLQGLGAVGSKTLDSLAQSSDGMEEPRVFREPVMLPIMYVDSERQGYLEISKFGTLVDIVGLQIHGVTYGYGRLQRQ